MVPTLVHKFQNICSSGTFFFLNAPNLHNRFKVAERTNSQKIQEYTITCMLNYLFTPGNRAHGTQAGTINVGDDKKSKPGQV